MKLTGAALVGGSVAAGTTSAGAADHPNTIIFAGTKQTDRGTYEFGVSGSVEPHDDLEELGNMGHLEPNDVIDGTSVTGVVGAGKDAFRFSGGLTHLKVTGAVNVSIKYGKNDGSGRDSDKFQILTPADGSVDYSFTCDGKIEKILDDGKNSAEGGPDSNDTVTENGDGSWTASGLTGNGYGDSYTLSGDVVSISLNGQYTLLMNGDQVSVSDLTGQDGSGGSDGSDGNSDTPPQESLIGGGEGYAETVGRDDADFVVTDRGQLGSALSDATAGDVVYVPGDARIDVGTERFDVSDGVTLASNRGTDGAPGGLLYTDEDSKGTLDMRGASRLTGLRFRGPHPGDDTSGTWYGHAVHTYGPAEIDNCEITGLGKAAITCTESNGGSAHVHHNHLHHTNQSGLGYGVSIVNDAGQPVIEYNYFYYNRHSVASDGDNRGYIVRYNHFGPKEAMWPIDTHSPAGVEYEVHNNVVEVWDERAYDGADVCAIAIRDVPDDVFEIYENWFWNPRKPDSTGPSQTTPDQAIQQSFNQPHEFVNVDFHDNWYGEDADVTYSDVIPGYDGWRSQ